MTPGYDINYPICLAFVDNNMIWWPAEKLLASVGVPGYAQNSLYNYFSVGQWSPMYGAT